MAALGVNSIPAKFNALIDCIGPVENNGILVQSRDGVEKPFFSFMLDWRCCAMSYAHCWVCLLAVVEVNNVLQSKVITCST
jgi:hypothetical protein